MYLTEADAYPQLPTNTALQYSHSELPHEEKSKFELEEKKFNLLLKVEFSSHKPAFSGVYSNKLNLFFPRVQILIFLHKTTQGDHIRLLY